MSGSNATPGPARPAKPAPTRVRPPIRAVTKPAPGPIAHMAKRGLMGPKVMPR